MEYLCCQQIMRQLISIVIMFSISYNLFNHGLNLIWIMILSVQLVNLLRLILLNANHVSLLCATCVQKKMISNALRILAISNWTISQEKCINILGKYLSNLSSCVLINCLIIFINRKNQMKSIVLTNKFSVNLF